MLTEKRRLGTRDGPPHLVAVVSLHAGADAGAITKLLLGEAAGGVVHQEACVSGVSDSFGLLLPRFKQRFIILSHSTGKTWRDATKVILKLNILHRCRPKCCDEILFFSPMFFIRLTIQSY